MKKLAFVMLSAVALSGCNAAKQATIAPQPEPIPIAETWTISVADSSTAPAGWMFTPQNVVAQTVPPAPCTIDFNNLMSPNTMQLPVFGSCAESTGIPLPQGQTNWLETLALGTPYAEVRSGEAVSYVLRYDTADGATSVTLGGNGTFTSTATTQNGTTKFNFEISGPINCLTINNSITAACTAWTTTFSATAD